MTYDSKDTETTLQDKEANEAIEQIKNSECKWPGCNKKMDMIISLPLINTKGETQTEPIKECVVPFCMYHSLITGGGQFHVVKIEGGKLQLKGDFLMVELTESVMAARETTKITQPSNAKEVKEHLKRKL